MVRLRWRMAVLVFPICLFALLGASAQTDATPADLIRQGNAAIAAGDRDEADRLYAAAEERTADPGLVAFNRAAVLFKQEKYRDAEVHFARVLDDAACPPERAAKAWYNRGTCLIRRSGATTAMYRSAIACLERCLDSGSADAPLKADARHNLELAKLLWDDARKKEKKQDNPNENPPPEDPRSEPPPKSLGSDPQPGNGDPNEGQNGSQTPKSVPQQIGGTGAKPAPTQGQTPTPGSAGHVQPLAEDPHAQPLNPDEAREHLRRTAERLKREQQIMRMTLYGPERPGLHDW